MTDTGRLSVLANEAPWFAVEVAEGRTRAAIKVLDGILKRDDADEELLAWARRVRALVTGRAAAG